LVSLSSWPVSILASVFPRQDSNASQQSLLLLARRWAHLFVFSFLLDRSTNFLNGPQTCRHWHPSRLASFPGWRLFFLVGFHYFLKRIPLGQQSFHHLLYLCGLMIQLPTAVFSPTIQSSPF
jgi:hypothetical protein